MKRKAVRQQLSPPAFVNACSMVSRSCRKGFKTRSVSWNLSLAHRASLSPWTMQLTFLSVLFCSANFTRFYVLARSIDSQIPPAPAPYGLWSYPGSQKKGLLRIREPQDHDPSGGLLTSNTIRKGCLVNLLSALDLEVCRIDRRPVLAAKTFSHMYIVEVDGGDQSPCSANNSPITPDSTMLAGDLERYGGDAADLQSNRPLMHLDDDGVWALRLQEAADRVKEAGGEAEVLGCW